jgi:hypothetical protein
VRFLESKRWTIRQQRSDLRISDQKRVLLVGYPVHPVDHNINGFFPQF